MSSSRCIANPLLNEANCLVKVLFSNEFAVGNDHGREGAGADTSDFHKGEMVVGSGFSGAQMVLLTQPGEYLIVTLHMACGAGAHGQRMVSFGFQSEVIVKRGHTKDPGWRNFEFFRNVSQGIPIQIAQGFLGGVQGLDQGIRAKVMAVNGSIDGLSLPRVDRMAGMIVAHAMSLLGKEMRAEKSTRCFSSFPIFADQRNASFVLLLFSLDGFDDRFCR
jgi:hypothetical protein|nr:hypothetical protein [Desulfobulbus propionicus]